MKTLLNALVAFGLIAGVATSAHAFDTKKFWQMIEANNK